MKLSKTFCAMLGCGTFFFTPVAVSATEDEEGISAEVKAADERAAAVGKQIWLNDQAAWHGTGALLASVSLEDHPELRGYLTEGNPEGGIDLVFYAELSDSNFEFARFTVDGSVVVAGGKHGNPKDHPLSPDLEAKVAAREAAIAHAIDERISLCTNADPNLVVLDPDSEGIISVYLLSAPTDPESYPLGGHYLYRLGPDGALISRREFMKTCLNVPMAAASSGDSVPVAFAVTHILDDHPTEIHYFVQRYAEMTLMVMAGGETWSVE